MSNWCIALFLIGVAGSAGCSGETAPPQPATVTVDTQPPPPVMNAPKPQPSVESFAVYALSRGKGVPEEARAALRRVVQLAEEDQRRGVKVTVATTRIGIEGETRVCFTYEDPQEGARACDRARAVVANVDLVNLAVERCREAANNKQENES